MPNSEEKLLSTLESNIERVEATLQQLDALAGESLESSVVQARIDAMMGAFDEVTSELPGDGGVIDQDHAFS